MSVGETQVIEITLHIHPDAVIMSEQALKKNYILHTFTTLGTFP